jgi:hypothetical protein
MNATPCAVSGSKGLPHVSMPCLKERARERESARERARAGKSERESARAS